MAAPTTTHVLVLDSTVPALIACGEEKQSHWQFGDVSVHAYVKVKYDIITKQYGDGVQAPLLAVDGIAHVTGFIDVSSATMIATDPARIGHAIASAYVEVAVMGSFPTRHERRYCTKYRVDLVKQRERYDLDVRNVPCHIVYDGEDPKYDGKLMNVDEAGNDTVVMSLTLGLRIPEHDRDMAIRYDATSDECEVYSSEILKGPGRDTCLALRDSMLCAFDEITAETYMFHKTYGVILANHAKSYYVFIDPSLNRAVLNTYDKDAPLRVAMEAATTEHFGNVLLLPPQFETETIIAYLWGEWLFGADVYVQAYPNSMVQALATFLGKKI